MLKKSIKKAAKYLPVWAFRALQPGPSAISHAASFAFFDMLYTRKLDCVSLFLRSGQPDSDTLPLLEFADDALRPHIIFLITTQPATTQKYLPFLSQGAGNTELVVVRAEDRRHCLLSSSHIFLKNSSDAPELRFDVKKRKILRIDHGLVTKLPTGHPPPEIDAPLHYDKKTTPGLQVAQGYIHACSLLASKTTLHPSQVRPIGYPRFYRARQLRQKQRLPCLTQELHEKLSAPQGLKVLWAPTHPPRKKKPIFLPFSDFYEHDFQTFCSIRNITLFIRTHVSNDSYETRNGLKLDQIQEIPEDHAPGAIEILPYFDLVITDWSSIMMEAIALDIAVVHTVPEGVVPPVKFEVPVSLPGLIVRSCGDLYKVLADGKEGFLKDNTVTKQFWNLSRTNSLKDAYLKCLQSV